MRLLDKGGLKMKKLIKAIPLVLLFLMSGCSYTANPVESLNHDHGHGHDQDAVINHYFHLGFENALIDSATDIVVVQFVGSREIDSLTKEFEFIVHERLLGDATERIFVLVQTNHHSHVLGWENHLHFHPEDLVFDSGVYYILPLRNINDPYAAFYREEDMFVFIRGMVINLENPEKSVMYGDKLNNHVDGIELTEETPTIEIISLVSEIAEFIEVYHRWERIFIRSNYIEEIVLGSPYVWLIEIGEAMRLSNEFYPNPPLLTDLYYITIIESIKGEMDTRDGLVVVFFADTVQPGEKHIVALTPIEEGSTWYDFTSRYSLFRMDQLDEILAIINGGY